MKRRKHILLFILFLTSMLWVMLEALQSLPKRMGAGDFDLQQRIAVSNASFVYVLDRERWIEFKLPSGTDNIRLISNANIDAFLPTEATDTWQYALHYQILNKQGEVIQDKVYHQHASLNKVENSETGQSFVPNFYLSGKLAPLDGQSFYLNLNILPDADRLRIRLADTIPEVLDAVVRLYYFEKIPERKIDLIWKRMSDKRKEKMASGNVYPLDLLTKQEIDNLLLMFQRPLSPLGIENYAYESRILYSMQAYEGERVYDPVVSYGVLINEHHRGVIPVPEHGGRVRLQFGPAYHDKVVDAPGTISIRWSGRTATERSVHHVAWKGEAVEFEHHFDGGLLEISAQNAIVASVFVIQDGLPVDMTPEPVYLRGYLTGPGQSLSYPVRHIEGNPTPLRVDFRYFHPYTDQESGDLLTSEQETVAVPVGYSLIDENGEIVKQDELQLTADVSLYDRIAGDETRSGLSEPVSRYFMLPPHIREIRFHSGQPVLIGVYNRPEDLVHAVRVPENSYVSAWDEWNQPAWFPVRPNDYKRLILNSQSLLLTIQPKPPEDKPDLLAGRYQWEDYHPQNNRLARYVFAPLDQVEILREEAFLSVYQPVVPGKQVDFDFRIPPGASTIAPRLAYFREQDDPFELSVILDHELYFSQRVSGRQGEIQLPVIPAGRHTVKVETDASVQVMFNHAKPVPDGFLRRLVNRFDRNTLTFVYARNTLEEESLSARLYMPFDLAERTAVKVKVERINLEPMVPMSSWSFSTLRFDVRPGSIALPVMGTQSERVDYGHPFFLTLGENLPMGNYFVHFFLENGNRSGYLSLSKVTPGIFQEREIFHETEVLNVTVSQ